MRKLLLTLFAVVFATSVHAVELGDDGLHKTDWMRDTFKDLSEDLEEANAEGKRLMIMFEQRGCVYCTKMHNEVFPQPDVTKMIEDNYFVVQLNLHGDVEVTDFDGTTLPEKDMMKRWGALFTPNIYFFPEEVVDDQMAMQAAVAKMPGAFGRWTTYSMLNWVVEEGYESD